MSGDDMDDLLDEGAFDEAPTEDELREAAELMRALARGTADDAPKDALGAAALLRHAQGGSDLGDERAAALFEEIARDAWPPAPAPKKAPAWLLWFVPATGLFAAAAVALVLSRPQPEVRAANLPAPPAELLMAQLRAAAGASSEGAEAAQDDAEQALGEYRGGVYAALEEHYRP